MLRRTSLSFLLVCAFVSGAHAFGWFTSTPPTPTPAPSFKLADVAGDAGSEIRFDGVITGAEGIASLSVDVLYDPADLEVVRDDSGAPRCNLASNQSAGYVVGASDVTMGNRRRLRVGVLAMRGDTMRDGLVYHCSLRIAANRPPGVIFVDPLVTAADPLATPVDIEGKQSLIQVIGGPVQQ